MKQAGIVLFILVVLAGVAFAQTQPLSANLLGAHNIGGRGCASCHTSAVGASSGGASSAEPADPFAEAARPVWGSSTTPHYGKTIAFGDPGRYVQILSATISTRDREVTGILVCLSCHDGNLTPPSMMTGISFQQRIGMLPNTGYDSQLVPTLLETDNIAGGNFANDHPVGSNAVIPTGAGLIWGNDTFTVIPGTPYAQFVSHYGRPSLAPGRVSNPWGINSSGQPFVLCTTCHNQHVSSVYVSSPSSEIAGDGGGRFYSTLFFINGPYDRTLQAPAGGSAASATQFCRQCHFTDSNEAHNTNTVATILRNY